MKILKVRNCQEALPRGLQLLEREGIRRDSRNGPVIAAPWPVATVYEHPQEKVVFHTERDYNVFFVLYEALWILAGRNDVQPLTRYVKTFGKFSDDGFTQHAAYGYRLRKEFGRDQLEIIARRLRENPEDRRCVAQIWDSRLDLDIVSVDIPCNDTIIFQINDQGALDMTVFCRSNDIIFGAYYANAFHFGMLIEYMARKIGCPVGAYNQISVNYHGYLDTLKPLEFLRPERTNFVPDPYVTNGIHAVPLSGDIDEEIRLLLSHADNGFATAKEFPEENWAKAAFLVLQAHEIYRTTEGLKKFTGPLDLLGYGDQSADWIVAAQKWFLRRYEVATR